VLLVKTRLHQYLIMFGAFVYVLAPLLLYSLWRRVTALTSGEAGREGRRRIGLAFIIAAMVLLLVSCLLADFKLYLVALLLLLIVAGVLALVGGIFSPRLSDLTSSVTFVLVLTVVGLLLTFTVEFFFLKDVFSSRMNTVFKFYYQAWVLFGISAAFGLYYLGPWIRDRRRVPSTLVVLGFVPIFLASLVYPVLATYNKTGGFGDTPTLDGMAQLALAYGDDVAGIRWLREHAQGAPTIVEATGGSYTYYGRVSVHTGLPTLLGWGGHELQWRGNYEEPGKREPDIEAIYTSPDVEETAALLDKYDVEYVFLGELERSTYQVSQPVLGKLESLMDVVFQQGEVTIYGRR
jgi:YYY domain-containing protein